MAKLALMESALHRRHVEVPCVALATGAVVAATFAAAVAAWSALPGSTADVPAARPSAHVRTAHGTHMAGMSMPGMKMPILSTAARR